MALAHTETGQSTEAARETSPQAIEGSETESGSERSTRLRFSVAISVGAVALAAAHLIWPDAKLDLVTLILLVIALVPWLGAIFESIKLPWFEVQYWQQLHLVKQRTDQLASRLSTVESHVFRITGTTPAQRASLDEGLSAYAEYLASLGLALDKDTLPEIEVHPEIPLGDTPGYYEPAANKIGVALDAVDDVSVTLRQYTHGALIANQRFDVSTGPWWLEDGLADYFVASHLGDPVLGHLTADQRGRRCFRDLAESVEFHRKLKGFPSWRRPEPNPWGNLFWAIRDLVGKDTCDTVLADCWLSTPPGKGFESDFIARLIEKIPDGSRTRVHDLLGQRGVA
jgi:hypothetical protein